MAIGHRFLMSFLVVALFCSWGFGLAGGALSSLRGFGLVAGAESSYGERWPPATFSFNESSCCGFVL